MTQITAARIALTALIVLGLTGCTGTTEEAPSEPQNSVQSAPSEMPEPLVAETPAASEATDADAAFLAYVRDNLLPETQIPDATDEQLIAAGHDACEQLESGVALEDVRVVEGEQPHANGNYYDTSAIMNGAIKAYCPDAA